MKKLLISLLLLGLSTGLFAQQLTITLPGEVKETSKTDFYFRDVVYKLSTDQALGDIRDDSGNHIDITLGETPDESIQKYLDKKYPSSGNKTEMIVSIEELSTNESKSNTGDKYYEASASLKFYILNGDMLVILGTGNAGVQVKKAADSEVLGELIAEAINNAIMNFNTSNWKDHPLLNDQKARDGKQQQEEKQAVYPEQKNVYTLTPKKKRIPEGDYKLNQIDFSLGYSYRLAKIPDLMNPQEEKLINDLKNGLNFSLNYTNYFGIDWGMGIMFNYSFANGFVNDFEMFDAQTNEYFYVDVEEKIGVGFIGPSLCARTVPKAQKKLNLMINMGLGYIFYLDEVFVDGMGIEARANTFGMNWQAALGIDISSNAHLMIQTGYLLASLSSMEIAGQKYNLQNRESLNRLDINLGVGFEF